MLISSIALHQNVQHLAQGVIQPLLQYCTKKKRKEASKVIAALYNLSADLDLAVDSSRTLGKKERKSRTFQLPEGSITLPTRYAAPTATQVPLFPPAQSCLPPTPITSPLPLVLPSPPLLPFPPLPLFFPLPSCTQLTADVRDLLRAGGAGQRRAQGLHAQEQGHLPRAGLTTSDT